MLNRGMELETGIRPYNRIYPPITLSRLICFYKKFFRRNFSAEKTSKITNLYGEYNDD